MTTVGIVFLYFTSFMAVKGDEVSKRSFEPIKWSRVKLQREADGDLILTSSIKISPEVIEQPYFRPKDCTDVQKQNSSARSGVYMMYPKGGTIHKAYCDLTTDGGGWTVFQRRLDGSVNFYRTWKDYKNGFGSFVGEHWLGNEMLHEVTSQGEYELRIDLKDWNGNTRYAKYGDFKIGCEADGYKLTLRAYHGDAGDGMSYSNGMKFTTKDKDLDKRGSANCAAESNVIGAWWFNNCFAAHLNGQYVKGPTPPKHWAGLNWSKWKGRNYSLKETTMMFKKV